METPRGGGTEVLSDLMGWTGSGPTMRGRGSGLRRGLLPAVLVAVLFTPAGCTPTPPVVGPVWSRVTLPRGVKPVTLTAAGTRLLVGGRAATARVKPRLLLVAPDGSGSEIPLTPYSAYAPETTWQSIASDGHRVLAVGGAVGGAHFNTRWTTWEGTNAGLTETPQPFDTFGGWGAGALIGPVLTSAGPAITGSWAGARSGLDAAIWLPVGPRWVRAPSAGSALESTGALLVGQPSSATSAGAGIVMPGSAIHLGNGVVRQFAAVWRSVRLNSGWSRVDLPDSGVTSAATSAQCTTQRCVVAGYVDHLLALWRLSPSAAARISGVPGIASDARSSIPPPLVIGARIIEVVSAKSRVVVLAGGDRPWKSIQGPVGEATSSALAGGWLYVIAKHADGSSVLWRSRVKDLGVL